MKVCAILLLPIITAFCHQHTYRCMFDQLNQDLTSYAHNNIPQISEHPPGIHVKGRLLQSPSTSLYGAFRIHLDTVPFSSSTIAAGVNGAATTTTTNLNFILQALYVAQNFYQKRLQSARLSFVTIPNYCVDFAPSNAGGQIANRQLVIFARYITDGNIGYAATGKSCDYVTGPALDYTLQVGRPTVGRIIFNTYQLVDQEPSLSNRLFQSVAATTIHQVTHILGFDSTLYNTYLDSSTGRVYSYTIRIQNSTDVHPSRPLTSILATPNVKAWAQNHYGCPTLPGMLLQNEDGTGLGSASHWERTAIYDQIMTGTAFGASKGYFGLTFALLKDTGWYLAEDTFAETSGYGYQKGCSFVLDACFSSTSFSQFCDTVSQPSALSYCQSTFQSKAACSSQAANMGDNCGLYIPYFNCVDSASTTTTNYQQYSFEVYSPNSFCVDSTLGTIPLPSQLLSRCYPYTCGTSSIVFTIGSYSITCLSGEGGAVKQLNALTGTLTCPHFNDYCTNSRKTCANWCSRSGFCMGGVCNCMPTNFGPDCSITTCSQGEYYHPASQTCTSSCPSGTYPNKYSNTCEPCKSPCLQCINTPTNCIGCVASSADRFFYNGTCYRTCPNSTFASGLTCIACDQSVFCKTCSGSATLCTSCLGNLFLSQGSCVSSCAPPFSKIDRVHNQCVSSCLSYLFDAGSQCIFCANGTYLLDALCAPNCTTASGTYYPDDEYHACMLCNTACDSCDGPFPENCTSCVNTSGTPYLLLKMCWSICPKGYYASPAGGKCQICPSNLSCRACRLDSNTSLAYCTSCIYGTFFFSGNSTCLATCNTSQFKNTWNNSCTACDSNCATCNGPSSSSCLSCPGLTNLLTNSTGGYCLATCPTVGYTKIGSICQACDTTCSTCNGVASSQCSSCKSGYFLHGGYCRYICPAGTYPDSASLSCLSCDSTCSYCFNGTGSSCTSCPSGRFLYNFTCNTACPTGMAPNQWNVCFEIVKKCSIMALAIILILMI